MEDGTGLDARRDEDSGNTDPGLREGEVFFSQLNEGWRQCSGRIAVIEEAAMFVIGDDQQGVIPKGTGADGLVDLLDEVFTPANVAGGVLVVGIPVGVTADDIGLDEGVLGQLSFVFALRIVQKIVVK